MRTVCLGYVGALVLSVIAAAAATGCSNSSDGGDGQTSGGQSGTGGMTGTGAVAGTGGVTSMGGTTGNPTDCPNVTPCGGNVVGTWNVASSCLKLAGDMDVSLTSLGCLTVPVTGELQTSGTFVANADGTYADNTTTNGSATFPLAPDCLSISSVPVSCDRIGTIFEAAGWTTATCADTAGQCNCSVTVNQQGGLGQILPYIDRTGSYTADGSTLAASNATYSYCASGDTLTLTPQMPALWGTVGLQREGTVGTGGAGGTGGAATGGGGTGGGAGTGGAETGGVGTGGGGTGGGGAETGGTSGSGGGGTGGAETGGGETGGTETGGAETGGAETGGGPTELRPCDIYQEAGTPCVAAHSTVRALFGAYDGALYSVKKSDGSTQDVPVLSPGGFADSSVQDSFCGGGSCTIFRVYDQTGNGNFVEAETPDTVLGTGANAHPGHSGMTAADATRDPLTVGGHPVYSLFTRPSQSYWNDGSQNGMPLGAAPQGVYMVTSGTHFNSGCCYDYGNSQLDREYSGGPMMDTVYFGNCTIWGTGEGNGPWVMADMEDGMLSGSSTGNNPNNKSLPFPYVTAMEKNDGTSNFALKGGDATDPNGLTVMYEGALPGFKNPMKKEGAITLGSGGDCCYSNNTMSEGTFYEGAIVSGYPSTDTDNAIHANIVEAGYGQ